MHAFEYSSGENILKIIPKTQNKKQMLDKWIISTEKFIHNKLSDNSLKNITSGKIFPSCILNKELI